LSNEDPYRAAHELVKKGQFEKALKEYQRLAQENPTNDFAWLKLGDLYIKKGDIQEGAKAYTKAAELYDSREPEKAAKIRATVQALLETLQNQENRN
jgi:tetratricopeptide (TPR) repeat protein